MKLLKSLTYIYSLLLMSVVSVGLLYEIIFNKWQLWGLLLILPVDLFLILYLLKKNK